MSAATAMDTVVPGIGSGGSGVQTALRRPTPKTLSTDVLDVDGALERGSIPMVTHFTEYNFEHNRIYDELKSWNFAME